MTNIEIPTGSEFGMTDLEEALNSPDGPAIRDALMARFDDLIAQASNEIAAGLAPDQFAGTQALATALAAARQVLAVHPSNRKGQAVGSR